MAENEVTEADLDEIINLTEGNSELALFVGKGHLRNGKPYIFYTGEEG